MIEVDKIIRKKITFHMKNIAKTYKRLYLKEFFEILENLHLTQLNKKTS